MDNQSPKMIHILDGNAGRIVATLDNTENNIFWGAEHRQVLNGENEFEFYSPAQQAATEYMTGKFRALIPKDGGGWVEMIAFETDVDEDVFFAKMIGAEAMHDKEKVIEPKNWLAQDVASFAAVTATTTYQPGVIEYNGIQAIGMSEYVGPFTMNKRIAEAFDLELQYRTETDGYDIIGRYFDMVKRIGIDEGKIFEPGKDLISLKKTVNNEDIVTALFCIGPEREDGTRLTTLVTNEAALQNWGWQGEHIIGIYEPSSENDTMTLAQLRGYGTKELNKRIAALITYEAPVESLEHIYAHERARLGDSVGVVHRFFNPPIYAEARVIEIKRRIDNPKIKLLTIGEIVEKKKEDVLKTFLDLQKKYGLRVIRSESPPKGDVTKLWIQIIPGQDLEIPHVWDEVKKIWVRVAPVTPEEIGAEPKIPTGKIAPLNPVAGDSKWVDTSGTIPILKIWNGTEWTAVEGPPGKDGYTPIHGVDYFDGEPGQDGTDGTSAFIWVRYSQNADGSGMVDSPVNAKYIGVSVTQIPVAPVTANLYKWTLIKGTDGLPGEPGDDGRTSYLHIKYSNNGGTTFTSNNGEDVGEWIGVYVDFTAADSNLTSAYTWNKVKGEKGEPGYTPVKGTDYFDGKPGLDGKSSYLWIRYSVNADGNPMTTTPAGAKYIGVATTQTASAPAVQTSYNWTLIKGTDGLPGEPGEDGKTSYLHIKYSNDGGATFTANSGETVGDWIGTYVDFVAADSLAVSAYTWNRVKGEKGDSGYTPVKGTDYFDGKDGKDGLSSYLWIRYSQNANGNPMVTSPTDAKYIGIATTTTAAAPTGYASYSWSLIKGTQGIPGETGDNGLTSYLHVKYSNDGGVTFTANAGESVGDWIGTYVDFIEADSTSVSAYTWNKVKGDKGDPGSDAPLVKLDASSQVFKVTAAGAISPASITIVGTGVNTIITAWTYSVNGGAFTATLPTGVTRSGNSVAVNGSTFAGNTLSVKASNGTVADTFTIAKVTDGAQGGIGNPGADAYTVMLTNESHVFAGSVSAAVAGSTTSQVIAYKGATAITPTSITVGALPAGMTATVSGTTITVSVTTAMTSKSGTIPLTIVVDGKSFTRNMSYAIAFEGSKGSPGDAGAPGKGVTSITEQYYLSTAATTQTGGTWQTSPPAWIDGRFMWTRSVIAYTDGTNTTTAPVNVTGGTGGTGTPGVGITKVDVMYYLSTSATALSGGTWSTTAPAWVDGKFMWSKTVTTYTNGTTTESAAVNITGAKGDPGNTGPGGRSIVSATKQYYLSTSSTTVTGGSWSDTAPALLTGRFMWERLKTTYANPSGADYGTAALSAEWAGITSAQQTADGKNTVFHATAQPSTSGRIDGDVWFDTDDGNKMYRFLSGAWTAAQFGENAIVANSITATHIKSLAGLNVNDQFKVDANGNVTFAGTLSGASGTFSGKVEVTGFDPQGRPQTTSIASGKIVQSVSAGERLEIDERAIDIYGVGTLINTRTFMYTQGIRMQILTKAGAVTSYVSYGLRHVNDVYHGHITTSHDLTVDVGGIFDVKTVGESIRMTFPAAGHTYISYYEATKRVAYMGYGFNSTNIFTFNNERRTNPMFEFIASGSDGTAMDIRFGTVESFNHHTIRAGQTTLKFLNSTLSAVQVMNRAGTAYAEAHASKFVPGSDPKTKKKIQRVTRPLIAEFMALQPHEYQLAHEPDDAKLSMGLMANQVPEILSAMEGKGVDLYGMATYTIKALQEVIDMLIAENVIKSKDIYGKGAK